MSLEEAKNPQTSPERLQELAALAKDDLNAAIAKNPNAPTSLLFRLWAKFPLAFAENPVVDLLMLESPQFWNSIPVETLKALLTLPSIPAELLKQFATHWSFDIRPLVAKHLNTPPETLHQLASTYPSSTQRNVAQNPNTRPETLTLLLGSQEKEIPQLAAQHPRMPPEILQLFRRVGGVLPGETPQVDLTLRSEELSPLLNCGVGVIALVQAHPNTDEEMLLSLYQKYRFTLGANFAANPRLPVRCLEEMANPSQGAASSFLTLPLAKNPSSTQKVLEGCLRSSESQVAIAVANRKDLSRELQERLTKDKDDLVLLALTKNPATLLDVILPLSQKKNWHIRAAIAARADTPANVLEELSKDKREGVRVEVARNPRTPPAILAWLVQDDSEEVKRVARGNLNAPNQAIQELEEAKSNPEFSVARLQKLSEGGPYAKHIAVNHPNTPETLLYQIASSPVVLDRVIVAKSHKTPSALLIRLSKDPAFAVRAAVAANVATPPSVLDELSKESKVELILHAVAENQATPPSTLESLLDVRVKGLREKLAKNPAASPALLKKLFTWLETNTSPQTLKALLQNPNLPPSLWTKLGAKYPKILSQHPRILALPTQGDEGFHAISTKALSTIVQLPSQTEEFLTWAAKHPDSSIRAEVAHHPKTPPRTLQALLQSGDISVLRRLAKNPKTPQAILCALTKFDERVVVRYLLENKNSPRCVLLWIQTHNPYGLGPTASRRLK